MIPIKILCVCGQKYAFDVEPVNGRMPHTVNCPVCGADGTAAANETIAQSLPPPRPAGLGINRPAATLATTAAAPVAPRMPTPTAVAPQKKSGLLMPVLAGVLIVLLAAGGLFAWKYFGSSGPMIKVTTPVDPSFPKNLAELNAWYVEPPAGQNAAAVYQQAFDALQITDADRSSPDLPLIGKGKLPAPGAPLPDRMKSAMVNFAGRNQSATKLLLQGAKLEQSRYPMDFTEGADMKMPHLARIKQLAQVAELSTVLQVENQQPATGADFVAATLKLGKSLEQEPAGLSQLVRRACDTLAVQGLEQLVNRVALPTDALEQLQSAFDQSAGDAEAGTGFTRALAGERAAVLAVFDLPPDKLAEMLQKIPEAKTAESDGNTSQSVTTKKITRNLKSQRAFAEQTFNLALEMRKLPFPDRLQVDDYFAARMAEARTNEFNFCLLMMPASAKQAANEAGGLAHLRIAQAAIALERYRADHGSEYAGSLSDLVPKYLAAAPQNPFDGGQLHYTKRARGYELSAAVADDKPPITFTVVKPPKAIPGNGKTDSSAEEAKNSIGGIGARLDKTNGVLQVAEVVPYGPAETAGVEVDSQIVAINGASTVNLTLEDSTDRLRGAAGTTVEIETVSPDGTRRKFTLTRLKLAEIMQGQFAVHSRLLDNKTIVLVVRGFGTNTSAAVESALAVFQENGGRHVILDVRNNHGGQSEAVADVAGQFIGKQVPLWQSRRVTDTNVQIKFSAKEKVWPGEVVVLVDGHTYSGAELFASAFQTSGRARIWGQATAGSTMFFNLQHLPNGENKTVPAGEFLTANGAPLQGVGVKPDVVLTNLAEPGIFANIIAAWNESEDGSRQQVVLPPAVVAFIAFKEQQANDLAQKGGFELGADFKNFFAAAKAGHIVEADQIYSSLRKNTNDPAYTTPLMEAAKDTALAFEAFARGNSDLVLALGNDLMNSLPSGCIYFGGTDPGRGLPTMLCKAPGDPFFVLSQNTFQDGRYLQYLHDIYGSYIQLPTTNEVANITDSYYGDAQRRAGHDANFPNEPRQLRADEKLSVVNGKPRVDGFGAFAAIAGQIVKNIFDRNPDREFYYEESFPLDWMYPCLSPHGLILKLNRQPLTAISADDLKADTEYWSAKVAQLKANPKFNGDDYVGKAYAHLRSSIAGLYAWRMRAAKDDGERQRMFQAAETAYRQALALNPGLPEAVYGFVNLELAQNRLDSAMNAAQNALAADPSNEQLKALVAQLRKYQQSAAASSNTDTNAKPDLQQQLKQLKEDFDAGKIDKPTYEQKKSAILNSL